MTIYTSYLASKSLSMNLFAAFLFPFFFLSGALLGMLTLREIGIVYKKERAHTHVKYTHMYTYILSVISTEWLPSGLHPILGIAYFSNVYRNIGIILPSESD